MLMGGIPSLRWTWPQSSGRLTTRRPQSTAAELEGQCFMATCIFTQDINIIPTTLSPARLDVSRRPQSTPLHEVGGGCTRSAPPTLGSPRRQCGSENRIGAAVVRLELARAGRQEVGAACRARSSRPGNLSRAREAAGGLGQQEPSDIICM